MKFCTLAWCFALLFGARTCFAQMYTVNDLGAFKPTGINNSGQVIGNTPSRHSFRTAPNSPVDMVNDDLVPLQSSCPDLANCVFEAFATDINDSGQIVGEVQADEFGDWGGFRTESIPIKFCIPAKFQEGVCSDVLFFNSGIGTEVMGINTSGHMVGWFYQGDLLTPFRDRDISIGSLVDGGAGQTVATDINSSGQVVGWGSTEDWECIFRGCVFHAFRTAPNGLINPGSDLGTLGGKNSYAYAINAFGQVVGTAALAGETAQHAFRTTPNAPITVTDDLGTFGGSWSAAWAIDDFGQVVGWASITGDATAHAFLYSNGVMHDLNTLITTGSGCELIGSLGGSRGHSVMARGGGINNLGQIAVNAICAGQEHAVRVDPIYKSSIQKPIKADGSSIFHTTLAVIPVKFAVTQYGSPSCALPATIAVTRAEGGAFAAVDESTYSNAADSGSNFRINARTCQYIYRLAPSSLGVGTYRVDISINGIMVGHAVFAIKQPRQTHNGL